MNDFEVINPMDSLVELPIEKWTRLQEKLKSLWPLNVAGYYAIHLNLKYPAVREAFQFKVYCPFGDMDNGFIAINVKSLVSQDCILFSTTQDTSKLEEALMNTKLINWHNKVCIDLVSSLILRSLNNVRPMLGLLLWDVGQVRTYLLDRKTTPFDSVKCPANTYIAPVKKDYMERVDSVWPYKFQGSVSYFSVLSSNGLSYGLYSNEELLAWLFINEYNFLCHLFCEEEFRRKGFAEYVIKYVINEQLRDGNDVYAYVEDGNDKSKALFTKLSFVDIDESAYVFAQK